MPPEVAFAVTDSLEAASPADTVRVEEPLPPQFQFIGYSFTRTTASNVAPTNDVLQGQVIGRLFGPNSTESLDQVAIFTEQRFVPLFVYRPRILDTYATFRGLFKIDYTWGDQAYGVGNNRGGGLSAGQVNLQTLLANVEIHPPGQPWNVVVGLQRLFDNPRDPNENTVQSAQRSSYKLAFWGTQAVGVNAFYQMNDVTYGRLGVFQLWENLVAEDDDVVLAMFDLEHRFRPLLTAGLDLWYVRDRARGAGGISILGQGLSSELAAYNGATQLNIPQNYTADLFWAGGHVAYNRDFAVRRWSADAFAIVNAGAIDTVGTSAGNVLSLAANARLAYKYGQTAQDFVSLEALFTTGDTDGVKDGTVQSVITGNVYGSPVGIYSSHRALLLFPDPNVVSRYYSAVHDISNMGLGMTGLYLNASRDLIPNRFSARIGAAAAVSTVKPPEGGAFIGAEINAELRYNLTTFLTLGLSGAYVGLGDFYDAPSVTNSSQRPDNPWVVFGYLSWLMF